MADWRQIQARIRKAKAATDAPAQLSELYERTHDAMVAFELAQWQEKAGDNAEASRWYTSAAEKFRRAQWRTKAEEALVRLGAPVPVYAPEPVRRRADNGETATLSAESASASKEADGAETDAGAHVTVDAVTEVIAVFSAKDPEREEQEEEIAQESADLADSSTEGVAAVAADSSSEGAAEPAGEVKKRRRRGRRGGRKRHTNAAGATSASSGGATSAAAAGAAAAGAQAAPAKPSSGRQTASIAARSDAAAVADSETAEMAPPVPSVTSGRSSRERAPAESDSEPPPRVRSSEASTSRVGRTRAGEPAIASRISQLESQLRRLLACQLCSLEEADQAPAGPGVLLLSDSDQVTHYYIEACQTLRIGIGNLLRGGRGSKDSGLLKQRMAENLGIGEARVGRYLNEHCAVRWLQLDEGAPDLAHFAIAVLRPVVNE